MLKLDDIKAPLTSNHMQSLLFSNWIFKVGVIVIFCRDMKTIVNWK